MLIPIPSEALDTQTGETVRVVSRFGGVMPVGGGERFDLYVIHRGSNVERVPEMEFGEGNRYRVLEERYPPAGTPAPIPEKDWSDFEEERRRGLEGR